MKKKRKNKRRKSLTAVGAVVATGLTPGIITGTPALPTPNPDVEFTAANVVSINGDVFEFDELFALGQINRDPRDIPKVYGPPVSISKQEEKARQNALREQARLDSIRRIEKARELVYGPPPPKNLFIDSEQLRAIAAVNKEDAFGIVRDILMDYCLQIPSPNPEVALSEESDLIRDLKLDSLQLENLLQVIDRRTSVQLTEDMLKQLCTLKRIANFIVEVITPAKTEE